LIEAERSEKNHDLPSSSKSAQTGQLSLEPSISSDRNTLTNSASLSWDLLNSGGERHSPAPAQGKSQVADQRLRRAKQNAVLEVTQAYMKASVAKDIADKATNSSLKLKIASWCSTSRCKTAISPRAEGLQNEIDVVEMLIRFKSYGDEYSWPRTTQRAYGPGLAG